MTAAHASLFLIPTIALVYLALRFRHSASRSAPVEGVPGFRAGVGFTTLDGMQSISLLLENESTARIWVEKIGILLGDIAANDQTAQPSCRETLRILQLVGQSDSLHISLAELIYKAAGEPQREYSCTLSAILHFRIGENWFERKLETHRIQMVGLTASGVRRERTLAPKPKLTPVEEPQGAAAAAGKLE